jgi:HK97 family phage prohead protease
MVRAYSLLTLKRVNDDDRIIEGIASTPAPDRMGDIVEPEGAEFKLPMPLLWQHNSREPIGHVTAASVTKDGIPISARVMKWDEPGKLKDRLDEAWQSIKSGLVQGLSIGFKSIERSYIDDTYSIRFIKWLWFELSVVTIPANAEASITTVRSLIDQAASGRELNPSGAPEQRKHVKPVILREPVRVHPVRVIVPGRKEAQ